MTRGPKPKQLPQWLKPYYVQPFTGPAFEELSRSSADRRLHEWMLYCKHQTHRKVMQVEALFMSEERHEWGATCLCCPACSPMIEGVRGSSWYEKACYSMVWGFDSSLVMWFEAKLLKGSYGALDVYLPAYQLGVMVDGKHHDPRMHDGHHDHESTEQWRVDRMFDAAVMRGASSMVRGLVRLHYRDVVVWWQHFARAVWMREGHAKMRFILYTPSYGLSDKPD